MNKQWVTSIMMVVFALVFLLSAGKLLAYYGEGMRQQQAFRALERITEQADDRDGETSETAAAQTELSAEEKAAREYNALHEKNPDFWGWIKIDGTVLSYPVMHTPENPEYYLRRDFEGAYSLRGVPFLDGRCYDGCGNYIVYGHYMKDGTMFGSLQAYAKPAYCEEHPTITLNTANGYEVYTVMAAFYSQVYSQEDTGVFRYYQYADLSDEADFAAYVEQVKKAALYDTEVNAQYGEQLLTLSTQTREDLSLWQRNRNDFDATQTGSARYRAEPVVYQGDAAIAVGAALCMQYSAQRHGDGADCGVGGGGAVQGAVQRQCSCGLGSIRHFCADGGCQIERCLIEAAGDAFIAGGWRIVDRCRDGRVGVVGHGDLVAVGIVDRPDAAGGGGGGVGFRVPNTGCRRIGERHIAPGDVHAVHRAARAAGRIGRIGCLYIAAGCAAG